MGEVTEDMLDGTLCIHCGTCVVEEHELDENRMFTPPGHPRACEDCERENRFLSSDPRGRVTSTFMAIKGALLEETYAVFARWDFRLSKRQNIDRLRAENYIGASSTSWLHDVASVIGRRFDPNGRDRALVILAQGKCSWAVWKPILLWHITRKDFLLWNLIHNELYRSFEADELRLSDDQLVDLLEGFAASRALQWSHITIKRTAASLLKMALDLGLLRGRKTRHLASYPLPEECFLYVLHALQEEHRNSAKVLNATDWRVFLMRPADVEQELLRLHQFRKLEYQVAGSLVELTLPFKTSIDYARTLCQSA
jgi:hypothetical protein